VPATPTPAAPAPAVPASSTPAAAAASEGLAGTAQIDGPRNAPPTIELTPEQYEHLLAIRARLSPREAAIAETVITRMDPEMRAQWIAELSVISVDQAVDFVRSMIPKTSPNLTAARHSARGDGKEGEG
jgi:hypothetical protein